MILFLGPAEVGVQQGLARAIREPDTRTPADYARRIRLLVVSYLLLFTASILGIGLIVWKAKLFVGLTQRSNVETLTLAFFLLFFSYAVVLSAGGVWGALRILGFTIRFWRTTDRLVLERAKVEAVGPPGGDAATV